MLLERETELELLGDLLADLDASGGKVVLIRGEAGIGKSSLVTEFVARHTDGAHVLWGACDDLLTPQALGPFRDVARSEPSLIESLEAGDRSGVLHATLDLLSRSLRPTILVIEDTHWADEATLDSIKFLGRRIARTNSLIVLTFRENAVDMTHQLRSVFADLPPGSVQRIQLRGLSLSAVTDILSESALNPEEVWAATSGNPFFVTEMASVIGDGIPLSIRDSVMARVASLHPDTQAGIKLLSVMPDRIPRTKALELATLRPQDLEDCARLGLLSVGPEFVSFRHELIRRSLEAALTVSEQVSANRTVLASMPADSDPALLVHHARGAVDTRAIVDYAPRAARAAMSTGSYREASAHFETLEPHLHLLASKDQADLLDEWGENQHFLGDVKAVSLLERAVSIREGLDDISAHARSLTKLVGPSQRFRQPARALEAAEGAIQLLDGSGHLDDLVMAIATRAYLSLIQGGAEDDTVQIADEAIKLAETAPNPDGLALAKEAKGVILASRGKPLGRTLVEQAIAHARESGDKRRELGGIAALASLDADFRNLRSAKKLMLQGVREAFDYQLPTSEAHFSAMLSEVYLWQGDWRNAEDTATAALGSAPNTDYIAQRVLGVLYARQGRPATVATLNRMWALTEESGEHMTFDSASAALAEYFWISGQTDATQLATLREVVQTGLDQGSPWPSGALCFWMSKLGELPVVPDSVIGPYQHSLRGDHLAAAEGWAEVGSPYEEAMARIQLDEGNQLMALEMLEELGATAVVAKQRKAMRDEGFVVPRGKAKSTRSNLAGLTTRQSEILALLGEGLTNNQIADRLFVSPRTVEHHVSSVLAKLGAPTREDAVKGAIEAGLLSP